MRVWDCFFSTVTLYNNLWVPVALVFKDSIYEGSTFNWFAFDIFIEMLWLLDFFINCNRVNPDLKIFKLKETLNAYLYSPFMIPDAIILIVSVAFSCSGMPLNAKYAQAFRIMHFRDALYPLNLLVEYYNNSGQKRIRQI